MNLARAQQVLAGMGIALPTHWSHYTDPPELIAIKRYIDGAPPEELIDEMLDLGFTYDELVVLIARRRIARSEYTKQQEALREQKN